MTGLRAWAIFICLSLILHVAGTVGFAALDLGERGRAAGEQTLSTVDSLQQILGAPESVEETPPEAVEAETAKEVEPVKDVPEAKDVTPVAELSPVAPPDTAESVVAASSPSEAPVTAVQEVEAKPIEALKPAPQKIVKPDEAKPPKRPKPVKQVKKTPEKPKREKANQRPKKKGNARRNTAGQRRSGAGGTRTASLGSVRNYGLRVRARIAANKPGSVGKGRVRISLGISKSGSLRYARVASSSGNAAVDRAALRAVRRAAPFPRPPAGASLRQLRFTIPFTFR